MPHRHLIIIGSGPAGYSAAIYASRAGLAPLLFEGSQPGGQLTLTTEVENYPGFEHGIAGPALMLQMHAQAQRFGAEIRPENVLSADLSGHPFQVITEHGGFTADSLILATGASAKWLGLGKDEVLSRCGGGVSACATCDGFFFRGREIAVVGGGDTALEEAVYLTRFASLVHLIHRRDAFRASKAMQARALGHPKIQVHLNQIVEDILTRSVTTPLGDATERIRGLVLRNPSLGSTRELAVEGLFVAIGHQPNTRVIAGQLATDEGGYLATRRGGCATDVPGVFAAGDVADPVYRQAITAAASGCKAALEAERWLVERGLLP